jgi:L-seryl-tRNA(Ser) seleniumtransferase
MQIAVGAAIAAMTRNEAAYVSCGAASGITLAIAACMAGTDAQLADRLPVATGMKNRVVMHRCERGYKSDVAIRCAGATIVDVGDASGSSDDELRAAIDERTAAIFVHDAPAKGQVPLGRVVAIAREARLPVLVDAAFSVPPKDSLWKFTRDLGADAVFISGGKGLRGPQSTGLVLGTQRIVQACAYHGAPNDRIGRGMKVGKEELAGVYAAVKLLMQRDDRFEHATRLKQLDDILSSIADLPFVTVRRLGGTRASIVFDARGCRVTPTEAWRWMLDADPSVYVEPSLDGLVLSTECLEAGQEAIVGRQLRAMFIQHRR